MARQLIHSRQRQDRKIVVYLCALIVLLQLMINAIGTHYDHYHQKDSSAIESISVDISFSSASLHDCGGQSHCHGNLPTFLVPPGLPEFVINDKTIELIAAINTSVPFPPLSTLFKPPIT